MRLTNYGKRFVRVTGAILCALVFILGAIVCVCDLAHLFGVNQQAYNVLFIGAVMPVCYLIEKNLIYKLAYED